MSAQLIDGKSIASKIRSELKYVIKQNKLHPKLSVVLVGNNPASEVYVRNKQRACNEVGIEFNLIRLPDYVDVTTMHKVIVDLNMDKSVNGVIVQLPLPKQLDSQYILNMIEPSKDVDGFYSLYHGEVLMNSDGLYPCTAQGVIELIENTIPKIEGKHAVVIGRSDIVGKPTAMMLLNRNATVTVCHSKTNDLKSICKTADILISAVGNPEFITKDYIKNGAVLIDVGTTQVDGKLNGDFNFDDVKDIAGYITPVPGGVGPMTVAMLLKNTVKATMRQS